MAKTERLFVSHGLDGETIETTVESFRQACIQLDMSAARQEREVLWDTLEVGVERSYDDVRSFSDVANNVTFTICQINVNAEAVRRA